MIADVAEELFLTDIFSTTDLTIDLRSLDAGLVRTLSIYASIKSLVSINSDKFVFPESKLSWILAYRLSKRVFVLADDEFISLRKACNEYANTNIWAFAS